MEEDYITIQQAADLAGYRTTSNLATAARAGRLRTITDAWGRRFTTRAWLDAYLQELHPGAYHRGETRTPTTRRHPKLARERRVRLSPADDDRLQRAATERRVPIPHLLRQLVTEALDRLEPAGPSEQADPPR